MIINRASILHVIRVFTLFLISVLLSGCNTQSVQYDVPEDTFVLPVSVYRIGVGDTLAINVWRNQELSQTVPVRPDGKISVPLVGDIYASGKTPEQLSRILEKQLSNYVRSPQVTTTVVNVVSDEFVSRVRITGAVNNSQSMPYRKGMTVLDVVLLSGGVTPFAKSESARLYRHTSEGTKIYPIDLNAILKKGELSTNYPLLPSDIITVPERRF